MEGKTDPSLFCYEGPVLGRKCLPYNCNFPQATFYISHRKELTALNCPLIPMREVEGLRVARPNVGERSDTISQVPLLQASCTGRGERHLCPPCCDYLQANSPVADNRYL